MKNFFFTDGKWKDDYVLGTAYEALDIVMTTGTTAEVASSAFSLVPTTVETALMGGTWETVMKITVGAAADWAKPLSLWTVCGLTSTVGVNGVPNWDSENAATSGCLSYSWTWTQSDDATVTRANTCYYCNDAGTAGQLNLPTF